MQAASRRQFLQGAAAAALFATASPRLWCDPLGIPPGIQLYTVKEELPKNLHGTVQRLREIGYATVEGYRYEGFDAKALRSALDSVGLKCPSAHLPLNAANYSRSIDEAHALGCEYAVSPVLPQDGAPKAPPGKRAADALGLDDYKRIAENMNGIAAKVKQQGMQFAYHNHSFEFRDLGSGQIGYDVLLKNTDHELVKFEIDCGWMILAGRSPVEYFKNYPGRFRMLHIKDFIKEDDGKKYTESGVRPQGTELGKGRIDYKPIFAAAAKNGIRYYFVEQEPPFPVGVAPMEAAKMDYDYLHAM